MKLTTNKHKIIIIISVIFINAFANAQALICDTIPIWSDVKIILCREQHFLKFKNTDEQGGYFVTFYDTINKSTIVIKRLTWNLIPSKYAKDIITNKINACDTTIIFGTYLNTNTNATNNFKQKIYPSFEISYWDVTDSLKTTYDSIINSISIFQTKEPIDTIRYDQSGDTTYVQRNASDTHFRAHYGNYVKETGQPDKIYNEEGYIALHGDSVSYHFFERDYLGSVRAVFDLYGNLEQTNDYNVTGIPSSRHLGNADVHKHTGKEFQGFNGLAWYDNNARYYDPILGRFTTQDPLAETTPWLSPYVHCSNNPLNRVDPTGLFDISEIEEDQCYPLVIVIPSNHKKIDKSRNSLAFEKTISAAKSNNIPIIKVDNLDDYSLSMSAISALNSSVKTYALTSHGKSGMFSIGDTKITPNSDVSSLKEGLEGKSVFLYSCSTAKGPDGSQLIKNFSSQTSSSTVGAMHNLNGGYNFDGSYGLTQSKTPYIDMILGINNQNSYKMSIEGSDASVIYNLTISANGKLNWTSRNIFGGYYLHKLINFFVK